MSTSRLIAAAVAVFAAGATWASTAAHQRITTTVTWDREISPIIQARCQSCHARAGKDTIPLTSYEEARPWARAIKHEVLTRRMPVWHAARGYGDFANDPSLSPFEISLITSWVDGGAPKTLTTSGAPAATALPIVAPEGPAPGSVSASRALVLQCGDRSLPAGHILGLKPELATGGSIKVVLSRPDGTRELLGWFRNFDTRFAPTYWLRTPAAVPKGSRLIAEAPPPCLVTVMLMPIG